MIKQEIENEEDNIFNEDDKIKLDYFLTGTYPKRISNVLKSAENKSIYLLVEMNDGKYYYIASKLFRLYYANMIVEFYDKYMESVKYENK